jgi:transposase
LDQIALHFDLSAKSLKRWIKRYESEGAESLRNQNRKGRPCQLTAEQKILLKAELERDKQRVRVARHIVVLLQTLFGVAYLVGYLPDFLHGLGLSFHKAVAFLIKRDSEKTSGMAAREATSDFPSKDWRGLADFLPG